MTSIYLPYIRPINLTYPPENLEELVKESFSNFTKGTRTEFAYQDKLLYLDNMRKRYTRRVKNVKDLIAERVMNDLYETGEMPSKEELLNLEFMDECFDAGFLPFYDGEFFRPESMKTLSKIITIVMNYEEEQNDGN